MEASNIAAGSFPEKALLVLSYDLSTKCLYFQYNKAINSVILDNIEDQ